jgi:hypothetical protein
VALEGIAHQPEHRGPQTNEQRTALRVSALDLVHGLRSNPQGDAQPDRPERREMELPAAQPAFMQKPDEHAAGVPAAGTCCTRDAKSA